MQLIWKGQACFSITIQRSKQEQVKLLIDPFDPSFIGLKMPSLEADVVLVTHQHADHNNIKAAKPARHASQGDAGGGEPFVIAGPGEYEIKDVFIQGIPSFHDEVQGKERGQNTIFVFESEGIRICHLGDFGQAELEAEQVGQIGNIDILLVPTGGTYTIDSKAAARVVGQIEPRIVIPMHYALPGLKVKLAKVDDFLAAMGVKKEEPQNKLVIRTRDLPSQDTKVMVLNPG
jgi:L-ascorbate metabolism protein UlaG (beta-lactamase superfamily)